MCNAACLRFGRRALTPDDVAGRDVIEVGSRNVNGSLRGDLERWGPGRYLGVDMVAGPGVDEVCDIGDLEARYGAGRFDVVVSTEVLEHVRDWRGGISNLKRILKPGGVLLVTTRSNGFPYHGYPYDFWRYEADDIRTIFSDCSIEALEPDTVSPGIFVRARKPAAFTERPLDDIALYSIVTHRRCLDVTDAQVYRRRIRHRVRRLLAHILPAAVLANIDRVVTREGA
ncbi:MAG TPA: methyltransferase domain-containing protein [Vicinamibacterales bacterium]|jgi:SAM-dependent methyltransferase|nr:methyltransferase domain-containing protein [Vicinamibacterales bacterium]